MKQTHIEFDLEKARAAYGPKNSPYGATYIQHHKNPLDYSHAYVVSNENLRKVTALSKNICDKVLTIAGSGDQALFYTLNGAKQIDTFDISYCARVITDIKIQAIKSGTPYNQYKELLANLYKNPHVSQAPGMDEILKKLPAHSADFIRGMDGYKIFGNGLRPQSYEKYMITDIEYKQLQKILPDSFNFIWSAADQVHTKIHDEYDIINLSNIYDWAPNSFIPTLNNLRDHVRPGGYIIAHTGWPMTKQALQETANGVRNWGRLGTLEVDNLNLSVIIERNKQR